MAIELATAYISIVPSTDKLVPGIKTALNRAERDLKITPTVDTGRMHGGFIQAGRVSSESFLGAFKTYTQQGMSPVGTAVGLTVGRTIGAGIQANRAMFHAAGQMIANTLKGALIGGVAGVGALVTTTLFKGFQRLESLDRARHQLEALGHSAEDVKKIMSDVNDVVTGTPIALNEAMALVPKLLAANVKDVKGFITAVGDAAGFTGDSFESIAEGFNQVLNQGKLTMEEVQNQFRNLPVVNWLAKSMGSDPASISKMISDGKIGIAQLMDAVESNAGGFAKKMGDTIEGAMQNTMVAVARLGANVISAAFGGDAVSASDNIVNALKQISGKFDELSNWVVAHKEQIHQFFVSMGDFVATVATKLGDVTRILGEHPGLVQGVVVAFAAWEGITGIAAVIASLKEISTLLRVTLPADAAAGGAGIRTGLMKGFGAPFVIGSAAIAIDLLMPENWKDWLKRNLGIPGAGEQVGPGGLVPGWAPSPNTGVPTGPNRMGPGPGGFQFPMSPPTGGATAPPGPGNFGPDIAGASAAGSPQQAVRNAMLQAGFPESEWPALNNLINGESGWRTTVRNASSGAYGLFQFLGHEGDKYGALGAYSSNPAAQAIAGLAYIKDRYGSPSKAWAFWQAQSPHWYSTGGPVDSVPAMLTPGEHVLTVDDVKALGGQSGVYALRQVLHMQGGGSIDWWKEAAVTFDPKQWENKGKGKTGQQGVGAGAGADRPRNIHWGGKQPSPGGWIYLDPLPGLFTPGGAPLMPPSDWGKKGPPRTVWFIPPNFMPKPGSPEYWGDPRQIQPFQAGGAVGDTPEWVVAAAKAAGISPQEYLASLTLSATAGVGAPPGPVPHLGSGQVPGPVQQISDQATKEGSQQPGVTDSARFPGLEPTATGTVGIAGTSFIAKALNLPNEFVGFLIDTGAEIAQTAISAAISAGVAGGTMGAGAAAAPIAGAAGSQAAGFGIKIAAAEAKRLTSYGFQMAAIGIDSVIENLFSPIGGAPRWMGYDYTSFVPSMAMQAAQTGVTTAEQAINAAITQGMSGQGRGEPIGPVQPGQLPGMQQTTGPTPAFGQAPPPSSAPPDATTHLGTKAQPGPPPPGVSIGPATPAPPQQQNPIDLLTNLFGFDQGGWLMPGATGVNLTARPEPVFSAEQWDIMSKPGVAQGYGTYIANVTVSDVEEMRRELSKRDRLAAMRYSGRP